MNLLHFVFSFSLSLKQMCSCAESRNPLGRTSFYHMIKFLRSLYKACVRLEWRCREYWSRFFLLIQSVLLWKLQTDNYKSRYACISVHTRIILFCLVLFLGASKCVYTFVARLHTFISKFKYWNAVKYNENDCYWNDPIAVPLYYDILCKSIEDHKCKCKSTNWFCYCTDACLFTDIV